MNEHQLLIDNIKQKVTISEEDIAKLIPYFKLKYIKKKKDLNRIGDNCNELTFVVEGALRSYSIDDKGNEHVSQIALEEYWIGDVFSFVTGKPSLFAVEAIEDSKLLVISAYDLDRIYLEVPIMERFFRKLFENAYVAATMRINSSNSDQADLRYKTLIKTFPSIAERIPLIHIASYLGITPESLSRIRKNI